MDPELQSVHANTAAAPRVALVCALYDLACRAGVATDAQGAAAAAAAPAQGVATHKLCVGPQWLGQQQGSEPAPALPRPSGGPGAARSAGLELWRALLEAACGDPAFAGDAYRMGSGGHRQRLRLWQASALRSPRRVPPHPTPQRAISRRLLGSCVPPCRCWRC